ncbi:MAG TPA: histidine kinase N-terminal 7TM domain-containing protein [Bacillota bacterium]|jgi:signal transduction histidine kinase|nr:histidine kinase N-terminal 7TM domain-containing protein [Bacillota bacterium]HOL09377.1 histidine kinase N-terminal 7TM domain-containing protein [Bacillota bacterium]HPO97074.1 histidine kinase N-terminal 7TM domain-containing protein [Bacillota bacterium]
MDLITAIRICLLSLGLVLSVSMILFTLLRGKKTPAVRSFVYFLGLLFIWFSGQILRIFAPNYQVESLFVSYEYTGICLIGLFWIIFCLRYVESDFIKNPRNLLLLAIIPIGSMIAVYTNSYHHLFFTIEDQAFNQYGILFYLHTIESYSFCLIGTLCLIKHSLTQFAYKKKQILLIVFGASIPIITNVLIVVHIISVDFDITPFSLLATLLVLWFAALKYKLLDLVPMAVREVIDNIKDILIVVDYSNMIVDYNRMFRNVFPELFELSTVNSRESILDKFLKRVFDCLDSKSIFRRPTLDLESFFQLLVEKCDNKDEALKVVDYIRNTCETSTCNELNFALMEKWYLIRIQPINDGGQVVGRVVVLADITKYKQLVAELNQKNAKLHQMNEQLTEYAATVEELAITKERNRFARDVHDTLGQTMTLLVTILELCTLNFDINPDKTRKKLDEAVEIAKGGLKDIRSSVIGLTSWTLDSINNLVAEFERSGMNVKFDVEGLEKNISPKYTAIIYRVCQEALTNALRHGKANNVNIILKISSVDIRLHISDDGYGCDGIIKGFGLMGMEERVKMLNGTVEYFSKANNGFRIEVLIPLIKD